MGEAEGRSEKEKAPPPTHTRPRPALSAPGLHAGLVCDVLQASR